MLEFETKVKDITQSYIDRIPSFGGGAISAESASKKTQFGLNNLDSLNKELVELIKSNFKSESEISTAKEIARKEIDRFVSLCTTPLK